MLCFRFWEEVYYRHDDSDFPSDTREGHGHFVGISEHCGHAMTFKILTSDTNKIIYRSAVRSAETPDRNYRAEMGRKNHLPPTSSDRNIVAPDSEDGEMGSLPVNKDGEIKGDNVPKIIMSRHDKPSDDKFKCSINNDKFEEMMAYNDIFQHIRDDNESNIVLK